MYNNNTIRVIIIVFLIAHHMYTTSAVTTKLKIVLISLHDANCFIFVISSVVLLRYFKVKIFCICVLLYHIINHIIQLTFGNLLKIDDYMVQISDGVAYMTILHDGCSCLFQPSKSSHCFSISNNEASTNSH